MDTNGSGFVSKEEKTWGMLTHLAVLSVFFIPFGNIIGPLVVWLFKKDTMPFVDYQGKEALNFQISMFIYAIAASILLLVVIGIILLPIVIIVDFAFTVIAIIKANEGVYYRYPLTIRFLN